jgi:uncharacterized membrane protein
MQTEPLHPMIVHLPLAIAVLMPLLAFAVWISWWREWLPGRRAWGIVLTLQALLLIAGVAALRTGENEEDLVEPVVSERVLETHEEAAEVFVTAAGVILGLCVLPLVVPGEGLRQGAAALAVAATLVVAGLAVRTGKAGGELVYRHGAAAVYQQAGGTAPPTGAPASGRHWKVDEGDDD